MDIVRRPRDQWVIDFGCNRTEAGAAFYEAPFAHVQKNVLPHRLKVRNQREVAQWWLFSRALPAVRTALDPLDRFIVTPALAKHRVFAWLKHGLYPDHQLIAIARDDDTTFGILHSRFHELWSLRMGTSLEDRPRYTPSTTFETFPFPEGLTPDIPASAHADDPRAQAIAAAAAELDRLRQAWLNPPDLVRREPEVVPGYPDRILPVDDKAAEVLRKRTLTNLYNQRPAWLDQAHARLDAAVADAYGWGEDWRAGRLDDDIILARLFALNQARAAA
jgi:type II restriction/modification system DNA methylase subunit YeeA